MKGGRTGAAAVMVCCPFGWRYRPTEPVRRRPRHEHVVQNRDWGGPRRVRAEAAPARPPFGGGAPGAGLRNALEGAGRLPAPRARGRATGGGGRVRPRDHGGRRRHRVGHGGEQGAGRAGGRLLQRGAGEERREHNDANVLTLGAGQTSPESAAAIVDAFLGASCTDERHRRRVQMIREIERGSMAPLWRRAELVGRGRRAHRGPGEADGGTAAGAAAAPPRSPSTASSR